MQPTSLPNRGAFSLTQSDNARLQKLAPIFGIDFLQVEGDLFAIRDRVTRKDIASMLSSEVAYRRLLSEICSRSAKWIFYHLGKSCRDTLLQHSDARLERVAELYARDVGVWAEDGSTVMK